MAKPLAPGDIIHGYAGGVFGRDHYHCVRIEAVGPDWIVARGTDAEDMGVYPSFTSGRSELKTCQTARDLPCPNEHGCPMVGRAEPLTTYGQTSERS